MTKIYLVLETVPSFDEDEILGAFVNESDAVKLQREYVNARYIKEIEVNTGELK